MKVYLPKVLIRMLLPIALAVTYPLFLLGTKNKQKPLVTIITSVYNGDKFIEGFMQDITRQTIYKQCEHIIINANSPGNEEPVIKRYKKKYKNIRYYRLKKDPGLYAVWNIAIKKSRGEFLVNANLDDRMAPNLIETHVKALQAESQIDLVYSDSYWTSVPNETFENNSSNGALWLFKRPLPEFSKENMRNCLPACHPVWRKSLHARYGLFNPKLKIAGDHEMWLRAVQQGSIFKKIPGVYGLYYMNENGLSSSQYTVINGIFQLASDSDLSPERKKRKEEYDKEVEAIAAMYPEFFQ